MKAIEYCVHAAHIGIFSGYCIAPRTFTLPKTILKVKKTMPKTFKQKININMFNQPIYFTEKFTL
jgi:hypothetical protein